MNLALVRIHLGLQDDVVPFMSFDRIRIANRPTLAVLVAHEHLAIIANCPRDTDSFHRRAGFAVVRLLRPVLNHSDCVHQQGQDKRNGHELFHLVLPSQNYSLDSVDLIAEDRLQRRVARGVVPS